MTPAVLDRPAPLFADRVAGTVSGGRVTLEERLNSVLHEARTNGSAECPVCRAGMTYTRAGTHGSEVHAAVCAGCGSRLG